MSIVDEKGIALYGAANVKGLGHVIRWRQREDGSIYLDGVSKRPVAPSPISGFAMSHDGSSLAAVTPDAEQCLISAAHLRRTRLVKGAHLTFATAVTFTPDDSAIISVSADASATLTPVSSNQLGSMVTMIVAVFILSLIALGLHMFRLHGMANPEMMLQFVHMLPNWAQNIFPPDS
jgi:prolactin regulatory element-binding protein